MHVLFCKMEEDVEPKDEDGVDGLGGCGWDGWVGGLGVVGTSSIFGLVRRTGAFSGGLLTFALVSGLQVTEHNRGQFHFRSSTFSSQLEAMVGGALARASAFRVSWVSVGLPLRLDRTVTHRIRGLLVC
jgi:hypothetical protein